jgi:hypothetical protein
MGVDGTLRAGHGSYVSETEGEGFEPSSEETPKTPFKGAAFNRSATPPDDAPRVVDDPGRWSKP